MLAHPPTAPYNNAPMNSSTTISTRTIHSAIQQQVLSGYRRALRLAKLKSANSIPHIRQQFKSNAIKLRRTDTHRIEYLLKQLNKQLELYSSPHVKKVSFTS
jgi:hypothetical protein